MSRPQQTTAFDETLPPYILNDEVADIAAQVIADNDGLRGLDEVRLGYAIRTDAKTEDDDGIDDIVGVQKASALWACLSDYDAVVWVKDDYWRVFPGHRQALLTHALSHLLVTDEGKLKKVGHDVEAFMRETHRFGPWSGRLARLWRSLGHEPPGKVTKPAGAGKAKVTPIRPRPESGGEPPPVVHP
jgi:hypothetical protein